MSKSIPFNIKLSVNGQQVVVSCKRDVENLGKALGTLPTSSFSELTRCLCFGPVCHGEP